VLKYWMSWLWLNRGAWDSCLACGDWWGNEWGWPKVLCDLGIMIISHCVYFHLNTISWKN
jgi:hypothetical protein